MAYIGKSPTGSAVRSRYYYTATGGETSLSGADDNGKTLKFTDGEYVDVHLNGVMLVQGTDYGVGTANTISSLSALAANDVVEITVYDVYNVAKINSEAMRNRWYFTATGGETSIGTSQISGLTFPANAEIDVKLNGVTLQAGTDYNTTTANTVGGLSALTAGQVVEIVYYEKFQLADTVSKAAGGTFGGDVTFSGDIDVTGNMNIAVGDLPTGSVLQVVSSEKTDVTSYTTNINVGASSFSDTGVSATITPTSSSSKILVLVNLSVGVHTGYITVFAIRRGSSTFPLLGDTASGYTSVTQIGRGVGGNVHGMHHSGMMYLDSPATTSATTYTVMGASELAKVVYINGSGGSDTGSQTWSSRGTSTITLIEVAG
jgi:hypothetical protein